MSLSAGPRTRGTKPPAARPLEVDLRPDPEDPLWQLIAEMLEPEQPRPGLRVLDGGEGGRVDE